jgi:hypothetical protein
VGKEGAPDALRYFLLEGFYAAQIDILHLAACQTDKVVVMARVRAEIVIELAVVMKDLGDYAGGGELVQDAVYGREADVPDEASDFLPYLFR